MKTHTCIMFAIFLCIYCQIEIISSIKQVYAVAVWTLRQIAS